MPSWNSSSGESSGDKHITLEENIQTIWRFKSLQSCPTLFDPIDGSTWGFPVPGILQARTLEWIAISFSNAGKWKVKVESLSRVWLLATPWTAAYQAPSSMGFSRQEYWSGLPLSSPIWSFNRRQFPVFTQLTSNYGPEGTSEENLKFFIYQEFEWTNLQNIFYMKGPRHYELRTWIWNYFSENKSNFQLSKAMHGKENHSIKWNSRMQSDNILLWFLWKLDNYSGSYL